MDFKTTTEINKEFLEMLIKYQTKYQRTRWRIFAVTILLVLYLYGTISVLIKHSPYIHILFWVIYITLLAVPCYFFGVRLSKHTYRAKVLSHFKNPIVINFHITDSQISFDFLGNNHFSFEWKHIIPKFYATDDFFFINGKMYNISSISILKKNLTSEEINFLQSKVLPKNHWKYKIKNSIK